MCMTGMDKQFMHARTLPSLWAERENERGERVPIPHKLCDTPSSIPEGRTRKEVKRRRRIFLSQRKKWIKDVLNERKTL